MSYGKLDKTGNRFDSTGEHRMLEKARYHLKAAGITDLKQIYNDHYFVCILEGNYEKSSTIRIKTDISFFDNTITYKLPIKIYILMRMNVSNKVAMNRRFYELERTAGTNPLLILSDIGHDKTPKFAFLNYLENKQYKQAMTPIVLFPEDDFSDIRELKQTLDEEEFS